MRKSLSVSCVTNETLSIMLVESDESDTEGLRSFLSPVENYAVNFFSKELAQRRAEEKRALENRDRFLAEQREKLDKIRKSDQNAQKRTKARLDSMEKAKRSRRLADKENIENELDVRSSLRSRASKNVNTAESSEEYSPEPLAQFVSSSTLYRRFPAL